ncbi:MAG: hypothetical protein AB8I08_04620 [Sandaracinaceae bacterium]
MVQQTSLLRLVGPSLLCLLLSVSAASTARAQEDAGLPTCDEPLLRRPESTFPINGSTDVTLNAPLRVRYSGGYFEPGGPGGAPTELLSVQRCDGRCRASDACDTGAPVSGLVQQLGDELVFFPDGGWASDAVYQGTALGRDEDRAFQFCTGTGTDTNPPSIGSLSDVSSTETATSCDAPEGGYRIGVFFDPANDLDGPQGSIEYVLYQTRGVGVDGPIVRDRLVNFATEEITMAFVLPPEEATSPICVRVAAIDGVGNVVFNDADEGGDCVDPVQGNFFYGLCAVRPGSDSPAGGALFLPLAAVLLLRRRR